MVPWLKVNFHAHEPCVPSLPLLHPSTPSCLADVDVPIPFRVRGGTVSIPISSLGLSLSPSVTHKKKLGSFYDLQCSTCGRLRSSSRLLRRRLSLDLRTALVSKARLRSQVRVVSPLSRTPFVSPLTFPTPASDLADPNQECTPYSYPPTAQYISQFPPVWQPATLLTSDTAGQAMWSNMSSSIPNIAPKGQLNGSTINETYNGAQDPDCCELMNPSLHVRRGDSVALFYLVPMDVSFGTRLLARQPTASFEWGGGID